MVQRSEKGQADLQNQLDVNNSYLADADPD
jgi:hypothetical protein